MILNLCTNNKCGNDVFKNKSIPLQDDMEIIQERQEKMQNDIKALSKRMTTLYAQNTRVESMLSTLLQNQGIEWQEEDVDDSLLD